MISVIIDEGGSSPLVTGGYTVKNLGHLVSLPNYISPIHGNGHVGCLFPMISLCRLVKVNYDLESSYVGSYIWHVRLCPNLKARN